jgi:hypothetical protein
MKGRLFDELAQITKSSCCFPSIRLGDPATPFLMFATSSLVWAIKGRQLYVLAHSAISSHCFYKFAFEPILCQGKPDPAIQFIFLSVETFIQRSIVTPPQAIFSSRRH